MTSTLVEFPNPDPTLNPCLEDFWLTPARNRVLYGGRSSSKSWDAAGFAIFLSNSCKIRVLCTRQFQSKIEESVYILLKIQINRFNLGHRFRILENKIINRYTGSEFIFYGLWRSIDEIKSLEGIDIHWAEEAHLLTEEQWEILNPTIRKQGSQHWIIFNPRLVTDFVYRRFVTNPPPNTIVRKINYNDNPFLSNTMRAEVEAAKAEDYENYLHVYEGNPKSDDEESVIKRSHVMAAIDGHNALGIQISGIRRIGFDVADAGEDYCAMVESYGSLNVWADQWKAKEDELLKSCSKVWAKARESNSLIVYDAIGVGATSGAKFNELNTSNKVRIEHQKFFAGGTVAKPDSQYQRSGIKNRDYFANIKAQAWWLIADRFRNTYNAVRNGQSFNDDDMIFIDGNMPHLNQLIDELTSPKQDYDNAGRVKVEGKKDLSKRDIASPNLADAFIMANLSGEMRKRSYFG